MQCYSHQLAIVTLLTRQHLLWHLTLGRKHCHWNLKNWYCVTWLNKLPALLDRWLSACVEETTWCHGSSISAVCCANQWCFCNGVWEVVFWWHLQGELVKLEFILTVIPKITNLVADQLHRFMLAVFQWWWLISVRKQIFHIMYGLIQNWFQKLYFIGH